LNSRSLPRYINEDPSFWLFTGAAAPKSNKRKKNGGTSADQENLKFEVLVLHSSIPGDDQQVAVFNPVPEDTCHIILSSNIAESSVTVPNVRVVIDSALRRGVAYDDLKKSAILNTMWASQASMKQRAGRTGRVFPGLVFHLITRALYKDLPEFDPAAISTAPLERTYITSKFLVGRLPLVDMAKLGRYKSENTAADGVSQADEVDALIGMRGGKAKGKGKSASSSSSSRHGTSGVSGGQSGMNEEVLYSTEQGARTHRLSARELLECLPQPPSTKMLDGALANLASIGALTDASDKAEVTALGHMVSAQTIDISLCRVLVFGSVLGCVGDALILAACLSSQDPFTMPTHLVCKNARELARKNRDAVEVRQHFDAGSFSDPIALRNLVVQWMVDYQKYKRDAHDQFYEDLEWAQRDFRSTIKRRERFERENQSNLRGQGQWWFNHWYHGEYLPELWDFQQREAEARAILRKLQAPRTRYTSFMEFSKEWARKYRYAIVPKRVLAVVLTLLEIMKKSRRFLDPGSTAARHFDRLDREILDATRHVGMSAEEAHEHAKLGMSAMRSLFRDTDVILLKTLLVAAFAPNFVLGRPRYSHDSPFGHDMQAEMQRLISKSRIDPRRSLSLPLRLPVKFMSERPGNLWKKDIIETMSATMLDGVKIARYVFEPRKDDKGVTRQFEDLAGRIRGANLGGGGAEVGALGALGGATNGGATSSKKGEGKSQGLGASGDDGAATFYMLHLEFGEVCIGAEKGVGKVGEKSSKDLIAGWDAAGSEKPSIGEAPEKARAAPVLEKKSLDRWVLSGEELLGEIVFYDDKIGQGQIVSEQIDSVNSKILLEKSKFRFPRDKNADSAELVGSKVRFKLKMVKTQEKGGKVGDKEKQGDDGTKSLSYQADAVVRVFDSGPVLESRDREYWAGISNKKEGRLQGRIKSFKGTNGVIESERLKDGDLFVTWHQLTFKDKNEKKYEVEHGIVFFMRLSPCIV